MINELKLHLSKLVRDYTERKYLLAVSGGMDSVVLAHAFQAIGLTFKMAHCNFQLRDVDSDADERFVSILANKLGREVYIKRFDTKLYMASNKVSIQMAARELRYCWFQELALQEGFDYIVTAHHKDDLAETILLNLVKGTGYAGLVGIRALGANLLRPLLIFEKAYLQAYAEEHGIGWRDDASNSLDKYQRNYLRHNVLPLLKVINPRVGDALSRTSEKMSAAEAFLQQQVATLRDTLVSHRETGCFEISYEILKYGSTAAFVLSELLKGCGFDYYKCEKIVMQDKSEAGASFLSDTHRLVCDRSAFVVTPLHGPKVSSLELPSIPKSFAFGNYKFDIEEVVYDKDRTLSKMELLVPEELMQQKLWVRYVRAGDSMAPYGMGGKRKKVTDILNDVKVPLNLKDYIPIFQIDQEICWLVGVRSSQYCKVENGEKAFIIRASKI